MRKKLSAISLLFVLLVSLSACGSKHEHTWQKATCTEPQTCSECGETQGEAMGHQWRSADCEAPETCMACGETRGEPAGHDWSEGSCTEAAVCRVCGESNGEPPGHDFTNAQVTAEPTCQALGELTKICSHCGEVERTAIETIDHYPGDWQNVPEESTATLLIRAKYCMMCGVEIQREEIEIQPEPTPTPAQTGGDKPGTGSNPGTSGGNTGGGGSGGTGGQTGGNQGGSPGGNTNTEPPATTTTYVLNTNTMKFHRTTCSSVAKIKAENRQDVTWSRESVVSKGYEPCGNCHP